MSLPAALWSALSPASILMPNYTNSTTMMRQNHIYPVPLPEGVDDQWLIPIEFKSTGKRGFPVAEFRNMPEQTFMEELNSAGLTWQHFDSVYPDLCSQVLVQHDRCYFPGEEWHPQYTKIIGSYSPHNVMDTFIRCQMRWFDKTLRRVPSEDWGNDSNHPVWNAWREDPNPHAMSIVAIRRTKPDTEGRFIIFPQMELRFN
ncbi:hypothetical protein C8Q74DRAFT_1234096 [Fomes fomentarius]|nr:hypothetical protein C8Q74DRAFT_1234096 [Fomes fomentarius]